MREVSKVKSGYSNFTMGGLEPPIQGKARIHLNLRLWMAGSSPAMVNWG
jgi:hypothetical protein